MDYSTTAQILVDFDVKNDPTTAQILADFDVKNDPTTASQIAIELSGERKEEEKDTLSCIESLYCIFGMGCCYCCCTRLPFQKKEKETIRITDRDCCNCCLYRPFTSTNTTCFTCPSCPDCSGMQCDQDTTQTFCMILWCPVCFPFYFLQGCAGA